MTITIISIQVCITEKWILQLHLSLSNSQINIDQINCDQITLPAMVFATRLYLYRQGNVDNFPGQQNLQM